MSNVTVSGRLLSKSEWGVLYSWLSEDEASASGSTNSSKLSLFSELFSESEPIRTVLADNSETFKNNILRLEQTHLTDLTYQNLQQNCPFSKLLGVLEIKEKINKCKRT